MNVSEQTPQIDVLGKKKKKKKIKSKDKSAKHSSTKQEVKNWQKIGLPLSADEARTQKFYSDLFSALTEEATLDSSRHGPVSYR